MSGWGAQLPRNVYTWAAVHNFAKGGASTESFREEELWGRLLETAAAGDLVLIQFGHNDQKRPHLAARTGYAANLRRMAADVRALGAVPVLCTSVERRHFLDGTVEDSLEDYPEVVREIALELHLAVVDLNTWTRGLYTELGVEESKSLFCHFAPGENAHWPDGLADNTHFPSAVRRWSPMKLPAGLRCLDLAGMPCRTPERARRRDSRRREGARWARHGPARTCCTPTRLPARPTCPTGWPKDPWAWVPATAPSNYPARRTTTSSGTMRTGRSGARWSSRTASGSAGSSCPSRSRGWPCCSFRQPATPAGISFRRISRSALVTTRSTIRETSTPSMCRTSGTSTTRAGLPDLQPAQECRL